LLDREVYLYYNDGNAYASRPDLLWLIIVSDYYTVSTSLTDSVDTKDEVVLRWQVHLAKEEPRKLFVVIAAIVAMAALALVWIGPIGVITTAFVLVGALSEFLLPITFIITPTHVSASTLVGKRIMAWKDAKKCYVTDDGVKISPLPRASRLEAFRGVYLLFGDHKQEVLDIVARLKPNDG